MAVERSGKSDADDWAAAIGQRLGERLRLRAQVQGSSLTTFGLGGPVALVAEPLDLHTALDCITFCSDANLPWRIIGAGSNIVLPDAGLESVLIRLGKPFGGLLIDRALGTSVEEWERQRAEAAMKSRPGDAPFAHGRRIAVTVFGGAALMPLSRKVSELGLSGLEFAAGIPGSIGGAVRMNAGAHGSSMSAIVSRALIAGPRGLELRDREQLRYGYRKSSIAPEELVLAAELQLEAAPREEITARRSSCLEYRRSTQPLHLPSAGSAFKNPSQPAGEKDSIELNSDPLPSAARLLEEAGFKGIELGGISFSAMHANWLVKLDDSGTAGAVCELLERAKTTVAQRTGYELVPEIMLW